MSNKLEIATDGSYQVELVTIKNTRQLRALSAEIVRFFRMPENRKLAAEKPTTRGLFGSHIRAEESLRRLSANKGDRGLNLYTIRSGLALRGLAWIGFNRTVELGDGSPALSGYSLDYSLRESAAHDPMLAEALINESQRLAEAGPESLPASAEVDPNKDIMMVAVPVGAEHAPEALIDSQLGFSLRGLAQVTSLSPNTSDGVQASEVELYTASFA